MATDKFASQQAIKSQIFERIGKIALCLGSPARLKIVQLLAQSPKTVDRLSSISGQSVANTSQHLQRMAREGLVYATRDGVSRIYRLKSERILPLWEQLQDLAHELAPDLDAAENAISDNSLRSASSTEEIIKTVKKGTAVLLDVREPDESLATGLNEAVTVPLKTLKAGAGQFDRKKPIYVFCRGRYCPMASEAVRFLRKRGFKAYRLSESAFRLMKLLPTQRKAT